MTEPSSPKFSIVDKRGRTPSGLQAGNLSQEMNRLRAQGASLPPSPSLARREAVKVENKVKESGSLRETVRENNRSLIAQANTQKLAGQRIAMGGANLEIAPWKQRQPMSSLRDKGIPYNVEDEKELTDIRGWARLFYMTHDLVPLLIDIYSKFPVVGLEFDSKDTKVKDFYETLFFDKLNYHEFLPDFLGREYYTAGEVTTFAHFSESLGTWSSEEILNPDLLNVSKSMFIEEERVQLRVKDIVESLRQGPEGAVSMDSIQETPSERLERNFEYEQLAKLYPEWIDAAARDDGLDISEALTSRIVNRAAPWHLRGTPHLLRSFRTLMMEESLNAAQDAVADRLYSPFVLATLGIENLGDGTPWIPTREQLDEARSDFQAALLADFRFMVHNFGLKIESVFGRESVPRFDQDYDRIDEKLLQAWGIGKALISGGTASAGTYASTALNREFVTQMMVSFQNQVRRHIQKRMLVVAEAQGHYDFERKGGYKRPKYQEILDIDPDTGEERVIRVPKLLIPEVKFSTLNLRDETQEREFLRSLRESGVPISDKALSVNIDIDFKSELERQSDETVQKGYAKAQAMKKLQMLCDRDGLPYPQELAEHLNNTLMLRQTKAATEGTEGQVEMQEKQMEMMSPAGGMGILPPPPGAPEDGGPETGPSQGEPTPPMAMVGANENGVMMPPQSDPPSMDAHTPLNGTEFVKKRPTEVPRNRTRPEESDEKRSDQPRAAKRSDKFVKGPSTYKSSHKMSRKEVERLVNRLDKLGRHRPTDDVEALVLDDEFWEIVNMPQYAAQVQADFDEIVRGGARESTRLLEEALEFYEEAYGIYVAMP